MISVPLRVPALNAAVPFRSKPRPKPSTIRCAAAAAPPAPPTPYDVLGLRAGATVREIRAAYRRLAREQHPDAAGAAPAPGAAAEFVRLHDAYAALSDPDTRARYDRGAVVAVTVAQRTVPRWGANGSGRPRHTWETDQCW